MGYLSILLLLISVVLFMISQTFNGKGPEAAVFGLIYVATSFFVGLIGLGAGVFWLGRIMGK